ncbi:MAG TPA: hypothetical protein VE868_01210 [Balneolaceae bacterium]|nr:hypothetical protein [Balneolaceae bacterium]
MLAKDDTKLEIFGFGDEDEDKFYCLVNLKKSPEGIDLKKLSMTDPRSFDDTLDDMGCILLLRGDEVEELIKREDITEANLHEGLYELAVREGVIE